ncbi:MAG: translesion DNA synthesis-associated protein ImuA [Gammaproteobacteria bacterium]|nr:translesion DNA synthesis-associated protein ImuA [Gammaproteobacteria bacterium]
MEVIQPNANKLLPPAPLWPVADEISRQSFLWPSIPTGYAVLDELLPGGGWPQAAISEVFTAQPGIQELGLLIPTLVRMSRQGKWIAWVSSPYIPYGPNLAALGIDVSKILLVKTKQHDDTLCVVEQALRSGTCGAVLAWCEHSDSQQMRRLQLAARHGNTMGVIFRPVTEMDKPSIAELRLQLEGTSDSLAVNILKSQTSWPIGPVKLYGNTN